MTALNAFEQADHLVNAAVFHQTADTLQVSVAAAVDFCTADDAVFNIEIHLPGANAARRVRVGHVVCSFLRIHYIFIIARRRRNVKSDFYNMMPEAV